MKSTLSTTEQRLLAKLNTPQKIQDYIANLKPNFELAGDTCRSPRLVMKTRNAHCIEAAIFAALTLSHHGHAPLLLDLTATSDDFDHVVAIFKIGDLWGAISKSNHAVLRYRDPIYRTIRELALSYFHEYFDAKGQKTLRSYSQPLNLNRFQGRGWETDLKDIWYVPVELTRIEHFPIVPRTMKNLLRRADPIEIKAGKLIETKPPRNYSKLKKNWFL